MIREILAAILIVELIVIDSITTWIGLKMFGGITEANPIMRSVFKTFGLNEWSVLGLAIFELGCIAGLYYLSLDHIPSNEVALAGMVIAALGGFILCVNNLSILHKALF